MKGKIDMKKVKCYMIRKPMDIQEVVDMSFRYPERAENIYISETVEVSQDVFNKICKNPAADYDFLAGKGGSDGDGHLTAVEVINRDFRGLMKSLIINPEGASYCRYMGIF